MIKAEVTAESRPACNQRQRGPGKTTCGPHKNQRSIQILIILPNQLSVILFCLPAVRFVELGPIALRRQWRSLFLSEVGGPATIPNIWR